MSIEIINPLQGKLSKMVSQQSLDTLCRTIAQTMLGEVRDRVHIEGKNANNAQIGQYSPDYIKVRVRKYNRTANPKVILALTGQMENDWSVIPLGNISYGLGFKNSFNADKAGWVQEKYGRIYSLTKDELAMVQLIVNDWINKQL
jgi:hypothetical protein